MRKNWTVSIGEWEANNGKPVARCDAHSEKTFDTSKSALVFMWAKANCQVKERCWLFQGLDGWFCNYGLAGKPFPKGMEMMIENCIKEEDMLEKIAAGIELLVEVCPTKGGNFLAYCAAMRTSMVIKDIEQLFPLCDEYGAMVEADYGADEGSCNVMLRVRYSNQVAFC